MISEEVARGTRPRPRRGGVRVSISFRPENSTSSTIPGDAAEHRRGTRARRRVIATSAIARSSQRAGSGWRRASTSARQPISADGEQRQPPRRAQRVRRARRSPGRGPATRDPRALSARASGVSGCGVLIELRSRASACRHAARCASPRAGRDLGAGQSAARSARSGALCGEHPAGEQRQALLRSQAPAVALFPIEPQLRRRILRRTAWSAGRRCAQRSSTRCVAASPDA